MNGQGRSRWLSLFSSLILSQAGLSAGLLAWQVVEPHPVHVAGLTLDRLTASLGLLVSTVGAVTFQFSRRYLDGEPNQQAFLARLTFTVLAAYTVMLANNLVLLLAAWTLTSLGLHGLLTHYPDRPEVHRPARKKFLISRLGDVALVGAIVVIAAGWGTVELAEFLRAVGAEPVDGRHALTTVGILIVVAALTKSAQFPFHSWLPETMEAPTPVSALMHAGIINAGGALLLKFAPAIARVPEALLVLSLVGTLTATLGLMAMWAQVKVKRTLAWSTVSQMGFMMLQCGLAAFPAAWLHILGHGLYKAWSFLRSGEPTGPARYPAPASPGRTLLLGTLGTALAVPALAASGWATGFSPWKSPGELALAAVVALSIGQLWVALLRAPSRGQALAWRVVGAIGATLATSLLAFALYREAGEFLHPVLGDLAHPAGPLGWLAAVVPVAALLALIVLQSLLPVLGRLPSGRALYVHALHGFYFGAIADRIVDKFWGRFTRVEKGVEGA